MRRGKKNIWRRIPNTLLLQVLISQRGKALECNSSFLKCGLGMGTSFQSVQYGKGEKRANLQVEKLINKAWASGSRSTLVISHADIMLMVLTGCADNITAVFLPKFHSTEFLIRKHQIHSRRGMFYKILEQECLKLSRSSKLRKVTKIQKQEELKET